MRQVIGRLPHKDETTNKALTAVMPATATATASADVTAVALMSALLMPVLHWLHWLCC